MDADKGTNMVTNMGIDMGIVMNMDMDIDMDARTKEAELHLRFVYVCMFIVEPFPSLGDSC